jgi:hypothetical protein
VFFEHEARLDSSKAFKEHEQPMKEDPAAENSTPNIFAERARNEDSLATQIRKVAFDHVLHMS